ncbi:hypothetical protein BCR42DRAFT_393501 [Absidia repens]|uniref:Membrane anchor Opy2 N-terminal domain-containing protein n=1 Tax=Absidia repens TaxID=90262 RepID=A0A1X2IFC5_9FUNG|nr:hypothetical protein BCR42DRAFT_393501 [Absidia repens]
MKYTIFLTVCIITICLCSSVQAQAASSNGTSAGNCTPSKCEAICNPGCGTDTTCALGTMKSCGVCPSSSCVDNALLGLPKSGNNGGSNSGSSSSSSGGTDGGMIGGIVGGLVGGGLLLAAVMFLFFRHKKQKKGGLPFIASRSRLDTPSLAMSSPAPIGNRSLANNSLSSPTPYSLASLSSYQRQQHHLDQRNISGGHQQQGPRPISTATSQMNDDDDDDRSSISSVSQRGSAMVAHVAHLQQQQASKSAQAFQVTRVKPQIMRVNTVRVMDQQPDSPSSGGNLSRSGSVRTVLTRDNSVRSLSRSNTAPTRQPATHSPQQQQQHQQQQQRSTVYSTSSTLSPESSPTTATATSTTFMPAKRTSAPLLSATNTIPTTTSASADPFDDSHSVIEDDSSVADDSLSKTPSPCLPLHDALSSDPCTK